MTQLSYRDLESMFDDCIDETNDFVRICGLEYSPSHVLRAVDPTAYRCGFCDWLDSEVAAGNVFEHKDGTYHDEDEDEETTEEV